MASWLVSLVKGNEDVNSSSSAFGVIKLAIQQELESLRFLEAAVEKQCMLCSSDNSTQGNYDKLDELLDQATAHTRNIDGLLVQASELKHDVMEEGAAAIDTQLRPLIRQYTSQGAAFARAGRLRQRKLSGSYKQEHAIETDMIAMPRALGAEAGQNLQTVDGLQDSQSPSPNTCSPHRPSMASQTARYGGAPILGMLAGGLLLGPPGAVAGLKAGSVVTAAVVGTDLLTRRGSTEEAGEDDESPAYVPWRHTPH